MIALAACALAITAASLAIGAALLGRFDLRIAPALGFAGLLVIAGVAGALDGAAILPALLLAVAIGLALTLRARGEGVGGVAPMLAAISVAVVLVLPFGINDRIGALGAGLVNDDMASHLLFTEWVANETGVEPERVAAGYPLGPHALVAGLADVPGVSFEEGFGGLTLAIGALLALTFFGLLGAGGRSPWPVAIAAAIAALAYMNVAWLVQGAFKEPALALLLVGFAALLTPPVGNDAYTQGRSRWWAGVAAGVIAAGAVYLYSFPGVFWLVAAAGVALLLALMRRAAPLAELARSLAALALGAAAVLAVLTIPEWGRMADFASFEAFDPDGDQTGFGNLRHALSPLEALGIWPSSEFRVSPSDASAPALAFHLGAAAALAAVAAGAVLAWRRREPALLAAAGAGIALYLAAEIGGTPYTAAKALAITSVPLAGLALLALLELADGGPRRLGERGLHRAGRSALAGAMALAFLGCSLLVVRAAPVRPQEHTAELASIRGQVQGAEVLFLGRDDFIAYELRGARVFQPLKNFYDVDRVPARFDLPPNVEKFDFDAVPGEIYDRFDYVLTTSSPMTGDPPPWLEEVGRTRSYVLWERTGKPAARETLDEREEPGAILGCGASGPPAPGGTPAGVWTAPPVIGGKGTVKLPPGGWVLSASYDAPRPVRLEVEMDDAIGSYELPANLDFRGPTPYFPFGEIALSRRSEVTVSASLEEPGLIGRLAGSPGQLHLRGIAFTPSEPPRTMPIGRACGLYVDWFAPASP